MMSFGLKNLSIYFESIFANGYFNFHDGGYISGTFENNITYQKNSWNASILFIGLEKLTSGKGISSIDKCCNFYRSCFPKRNLSFSTFQISTQLFKSKQEFKNFKCKM